VLQSIVFDTQSLLKLYLGEPGSNQVVTLLREVLEGKIEGRINVVNMAELYYILERKSKETADEKEENLRSYGVEVVSVDSESSLWKTAATLKAHHAMSLADAFAAATAMALKSRLITGADEEFDGIRGLNVQRI
jgi:predicted nucleic acid-binding protein